MTPEQLNGPVLAILEDKDGPIQKLTARVVKLEGRSSTPAMALIR